MSDVIGRLHGAFVFDRRIQAIARVLSDWLPAGRVLDYGAGNGALGALLMDMRPDVQIVGVDVHLRPHTQIPMAAFDGVSLPFSNATFDATICVDVLHHIDEPGTTMQELKRVTRGSILVKDHFYRGHIERMVLLAMDWVGNKSHGVYLPYNYFTRAAWESMVEAVGLREMRRIEEVPGQYPPWAQQLLGRNIQFVAHLIR